MFLHANNNKKKNHLGFKAFIKSIVFLSKLMSLLSCIPSEVEWESVYVFRKYFYENKVI